MSFARAALGILAMLSSVGVQHAQDAETASPAAPLASAQRGEMSVREDIPVRDYADVDVSQARRPRYHFSSRKNWINDPNGLVHDGEKYHLFFQHNPLDVRWGNMTWGHATSKDLLHWTQQPHAILPYTVDGRPGDIWSGTAIVDHNNSLGKQTGDVPTIAAFFTFASDPSYYQAMAYSTDRCKTWTLHNDGRPVIKNQGLHPKERDPKVFWHGESESWCLLLWVSDKPGTLRFFRSDDLVNWEHTSDMVRGWAYECPDVFFAAVDYQGEAKTIVYDASGDYEIGTFDGREFHREFGPFKFGEEGDLYASQIYNNQPEFRTLQLSWLRHAPELDDLPFRGQMSFPVELRLKSTEAGPRIAFEPIREIQKIVAAEHAFGPIRLGAEPAPIRVPSQSSIDADIRIGGGSPNAQVRFVLGGVTFRFDRGERSLWMQRDGMSSKLVVFTDATSTMPDGGVNDRGLAAAADAVASDSGRHDQSSTAEAITFRLMIDRMSVEVFADRGMVYTGKYALPDLPPGPPMAWASGLDESEPPTIDGIVRIIQPTVPGLADEMEDSR